MTGRGSSRRFVLQAAAAAGGGFAIGIGPGNNRSRVTAQSAPPAVGENEITPWLVIRPDETVIVRMARSDLGQGTATGLAQIVAEELDCDWQRVTVEMITPGANLARERVWKDMVTAGSRGVRGSHEYLRLAGATARSMLIDAAAALWKVPSGALSVTDGIVTHRATGRTVSYGRLAASAARQTPPDPRLVALGDPSQWTIIGRSLPPIGLSDKLNGRAVYGIDVKLPGLLSAAIKDSPVFGGKLKSFDPTPVLGMNGVKHVLQVGETAVAVVADSWWQARKALDAVPVVWDDPPEGRITSAAIGEILKEGLEAQDAFIGTSHGDALKGLRGSSKRVDATYGVPFVQHATLEPMTATALWTAERVEIWAATQNPEAALKAAADAAGLPPEKAEIHRTLAGGAYGRRGRSDFITQAVLIARQVPGTPVKLIWSREEDTRNGYYRPASLCKFAGGIDEKGEPTGLIMRLSGPSIVGASNPKAQRTRDARVFQGLQPESGEAQIGYSFPNLYIDHAMRHTIVPVGSWRGVYANQNAFYLECFIDELATAAGKDPFEFRRSMMKAHARHMAVLTAAAEKAGWALPPIAGTYRGIAQSMTVGSYAAAVAEVSVGGDGTIKVHRVVVALDCGQVVNPDLVAAQIEGQVAFGLGAALYQEITFEDGRTQQANFDTYRVLRLAEMPRVDAVLVPSGEFWGGVGEAVIAVVAPAVANAVFAATGKRVRNLPLKHAKLT